MVEDAVHKEVALGLSRDKFGHFLKSKQTNSANFITSLLKKNVSVSKSQEESTSQMDDETLVDIHVNNPLTKIVDLLKDIKKQKAFTFTLKGSVGIVGVAVVLAGGGILGGNKIVCNKGTQARIGEVRVLSFEQDTVSAKPLRDKIRAIFGKTQNTDADTAKEVQWVVLVDSQNNAIKLSFQDQTYPESFAGHTVTAVGDYNMCTQELKILPKGLHDYVRL